MKVDFSGFSGRDDELLKVKRYAEIAPMFYRSDLLIHSRRVHAMLEFLWPIIEKTYPGKVDREKLLTLALVHDDAEVVTGDIQLIHKMYMSKDELAAVEEDEAKGIQTLIVRWPKQINGFSYEALLLHALNKDCLEAHLVSIIDKIDASCEALHELFAGNKEFIPAVETYEDQIPATIAKFPQLSALTSQDIPLFEQLCVLGKKDIAFSGHLHTKNSLGYVTGVPQYDMWKEIILEAFGVDVLCVCKEKA